MLPEKPILIYPSLAATIGLEEATLLAVLQEYCCYLAGESRNGYDWHHLREVQVQQYLPFWGSHDIQRVSTNLREKGLIFITSAPYDQSKELRFALNTQRLSSPQTAPPTASNPVANTVNPTTNNRAGLNTIAPHWQPDRETYERLAQHNIPSHFAREQIPEFVNYWRERNEAKRAWGTMFMKHVLRNWHQYQANHAQRSSSTQMYKGWRPSEDAIEVLTRHGGISMGFVEDAIPEFVLYWREQGSSADNWHRKFRDHVHRQWLKFCSAIEHDSTPRRIAANWTPSKDVFDVLSLANIDLAFAESLIPEFVIYWRDTNQVHASWNTRFLQFVKKRWANGAYAIAAPGSATDKPKSTRELTLHEELTDRSWAN